LTHIPVRCHQAGSPTSIASGRAGPLALNRCRTHATHAIHPSYHRLPTPSVLR
jgi:hypothetical protein